MSHICPTCQSACYCGGDFSDRDTGARAYCSCCREYETAPPGKIYLNGIEVPEDYFDPRPENGLDFTQPD